MSRIEQALFYLFVDGSLQGVMATHVDDLFCTGAGEKFQATLKGLETDPHLKVKEDDFRFCRKTWSSTRLTPSRASTMSSSRRKEGAHQMHHSQRKRSPSSED